MIAWKQRLTATLRLSSKILFIVTILVALGGCDKKDSVSKVEWFTKVSVVTGLVEEGTSWENVKDSLIQWGINPKILQEGILVREEVAVFFSDWLQLTESDSVLISDLAKAKYPLEVKKVLNKGLFSLDKQSNFHPQNQVSSIEAQKLLDDFLLVVDEFDNSYHWKLEFDQEIEVKEVNPYRFDEDTLMAQFQIEDKVSEGDIVHFSENQIPYFYQVNEIVDGVARLETVPLNLVKHIEASGELELNWDEIEFTPPNSESSVIGQEERQIRLLSSTDFKKEFKIENFTVRLNYTSSSLSVYLFKKTDLEANAFAEINLTNIHPIFSYKGSLFDIEEASFKINWNTSMATGLKKGSYQQLFLSPDKINPEKWLSSLESAWVTKKATIDTIIPLGKISIPVSNFPGINFVLQLQARLYLNGRVEILYTLENELGIEIRNNQMRTINHVTRDLDFLMQATTGISGKVLAGVEILDKRIVDVGMSTGIKGEVKSTLHMMDSDNTFQVDQIPYDVLEELTQGQNGLLLCGDLCAYWTCDLSFNSSSSLANKLGLHKEIELLNKKNAALFSGSIKHIENMQFVEKCTRSGNRKPAAILQTTTDRIILGSYSMIVLVGEENYVKVRGLPKGLNLTDLVFTSSDECLATIDQKGKVTGVKEGALTITISSKENDYLVKCSVLVKNP